jgi:autotransporter-associated beta strand protein
MKTIIKSALVLAFIAAEPIAHADTHVWSGFFDGNWSNSGNWSSGGAPSTNEAAPVKLEFPSGFIWRTAITNDIPGLQVDLISLDSSGLNGGHYDIRSPFSTVLTLKGGGVTFTNTGSGNVFFAHLNLSGSNLVSVAENGDVSFGNLIGNGSLTLSGAGTAFFRGTTANSYVGPLTVLGGFANLSQSNNWAAVLSSLEIGDNEPGVHGYVQYYSDNQVADGAPVTVNSSGQMHMGGHNDSIVSLTMNGGEIVTEGGLLTLLGNISQPGASSYSSILGRLSLGAATRTFDVTSGLSIGASISGAPGVGLIKNGPGFLQFTGTNSYNGPTTVNSGAVYLYGPGTNSDFIINPGSRLMLHADAAGVVATGGLVDFGPYFAQLNCRDLAITNNGTLQILLNSPVPGTNCDQLHAHGTVVLTGGNLDFQSYLNPAAGTKFVIIDNAGNGPVIGNFNGLPEGHVLNYNSELFQITYKGGDGNDVVVTRVSTALAAASIGSVQRLGNGSVQIGATGSPGITYTVMATDSLTAPANWTQFGFASTDAQGHLNFTDTDAPNHPMRFYQLMLP